MQLHLGRDTPHGGTPNAAGVAEQNRCAAVTSSERCRAGARPDLDE
jgi:hypothetical protein